jgi:alanine dehydrogenase
MRKPDFRVSVIADVTCDIDGSVPSTLRSSTIEEPFYGYNPVTEQLDEPFIKDTITVMAVDNLPCELPRDASEDFGKSLVERVFPALLAHKDPMGMIERATITQNGKLTERFNYLADWVGA